MNESQQLVFLLTLSLCVLWISTAATLWAIKLFRSSREKTLLDILSQEASPDEDLKDYDPKQFLKDKDSKKFERWFYGQLMKTDLVVKEKISKGHAIEGHAVEPFEVTSIWHPGDKKNKTKNIKEKSRVYKKLDHTRNVNTEKIQFRSIKSQELNENKNSDIGYLMKFDLNGQFENFFEVDKNICRIGRGRNCELKLADHSVAHHHAEIVIKDQQYYLKDLGQSARILLNEEILKPNSETLLSEGDVIDIGKYKLMFTKNKAVTLVNYKEQQDKFDQAILSCAKSKTEMGFVLLELSDVSSHDYKDFYDELHYIKTTIEKGMLQKNDLCEIISMSEFALALPNVTLKVHHAFLKSLKAFIKQNLTGYLNSQCLGLKVSFAHLAPKLDETKWQAVYGQLKDDEEKSRDLKKVV